MAAALNLIRLDAWFNDKALDPVDSSYPSSRDPGAGPGLQWATATTTRATRSQIR